MSPKRLKGVVLDFDGTLVNSAIDFRAMKEALLSELVTIGIPREALDANDTIVANLTRARRSLSETGREGEIPRIENLVNRCMSEVEMRNVGKTTAIAGAREALAALRERGYRVGLLTRGTRLYISSALRVAGFSEKDFDAIICRDDFPEQEAKPNGKAMRRVAEMLGLDIAECVMLGDHPIDLECARASGSEFVGVVSGWSNETVWREKGCGMIILSIADLPGLMAALERDRSD